MNVGLCPDRERLESYALGKLAPDDLDSVSEHLLACPNCDSVVESLESASDSLIDELHKPALEDQIEQEPELRQSLEALRDGPPQPPARQVDASPLAVAEDNKTTDLGSVREYRLLEKIGQGGMGTVYKAVHSRLKRVVAIKLLPEDRKHDEVSIRRFAREMEAIGKLEHPNIVKAVDAGEDGGRHYLVIEYVKGTNLRSYIKSKGKLTARQTAHIGFYVARALEHANEHGIIHRDVKPANILLSTSGKVKLADLGLAKFFDESSRPLASSTLAGELLGSIDYLAPEQAQDATQADTRSDIYALGCTLYHCLTGRPLFVEGTNVQKIMAQIEKEPEHILDLNPDVPEQLAELIHTRMLAKRPEDRFQTPREVALALKPWAGKATPVQARSAARVMDSGSTHSQRGGSVGTLADLSALELGEAEERPAEDLPRRRRGGRIRGLRRKSRVADYLERTRALLNDWKVIGHFVLAESTREPTANELQRYQEAREGILMQYDSLLPILQRRSGPGGHQTIATCAELATLYEVEELGVKRRQKLRDDWQRGHNYLVDFLVFLEQVRARLNSLNPVSYAVGAAWDTPAVRPVVALLLFLAGGYYLSGIVLKVETAIGTLLIEIDQPEARGASVSIDDEFRVLITAPGDEDPVEIRVDEGRRTLKVAKAGFETFTREFTIKSKDRKIIRVYLERESSLDKSPGPVVKRPVPETGGGKTSTPFVSPPPAKDALKAQVPDPEVWQPGVEVRQFASERVHGVAFTPDGSRVIGAGWTQPIFVWDRETGKTVQQLASPANYIFSIAISPNGHYLLGGFRHDHNLALWDLRTGEGIRRMKGHSNEVRSVAFSPDGSRALSGSADGTVRVWDVETGRELARFDHAPPVPQASSVRGVAFSPDGRRALSGGAGVIRLWDLDSGEQIRQFDYDAISLAFVSESRALAGDGDGLIRMWNVDTGEELLRMDKHFDDVHSLAVSPNRRYVLSGSRDTTARLWDLETGWEVRRMKGHSQDVLSVALSPDGRYAVSGSFDGTVRLWDLGKLGTTVTGPRATSNASGPALYGGVVLQSVWSALKPGTIVTMDSSSGRATTLGFPAVAGEKTFGVTGLAFSSKGELFASVYARDGREGKTSIPPTLIGIDPNTGTLLGKIGEIRDARGRPVKITDLAMQPETDVLFGIGGGVIGPILDPRSTGAAKLYRIDTSTAVATLVRNTRRSFGGCIAFSPTGTLYHCTFLGPYLPWEKRKPALTVLDPANGRLIKTIPFQDGLKISHLIVPRGLAVRPGDETIFLSMNYTRLRERPNTELQNNLLATIDPETGMVTPLATSIEDVQNRIGDLAFRPGKSGEQVAVRSKPPEPVARNRAGSTGPTPIPRGAIIVNSTADPGDGRYNSREGTLREAIAEANKKRGINTIAFAIPGDGPHTIQPTSPLPEITDPVIIDGTTQTGFTGVPIIVLNGSSTGDGAAGLAISAGNSTVRGLVIQQFSSKHFSSNGIRLSVKGGNVIEGNYIGTRVTGAAPLGNYIGIRIENGSQANLIGTNGDGVEDAAERNVISGNIESGIKVVGASTSRNVVAGNYIGTDVTGTAPLGNGYGVSIHKESHSNLIGTDSDGVADAAERNLLSGNTVYGVGIASAGTTKNVVAGNYIGTDVTGTAPLGNGRQGVRINEFAKLNRIGTNGDGVHDQAERNLISANLEGGVAISDIGTDENVVAGNFIGTDVTGTVALSNGKYGNGVHIGSGARSNRIGTDGDGTADADERNILSGNGGSGIVISDGGTDQHVVAGNYIGTDVTGTAPLGNGAYGVQILAGAQSNLIGTNGDGVADEAEGNLISGNQSGAVQIEGTGTDDNVVAGNLIDTFLTGKVAEQTSSVAPSKPAAQTVIKPQLPDPENWKPAREIRTYDSERVQGIAFTADGRRVIGAGTRPIYIWERRSGKLFKELASPGSYIRCGAVSPDRRFFLTGYGTDPNPALWDLQTFEGLRRMRGHAGPINSVAFSPDSNRALSGSDDGTARLWNVGTGAELASFEHDAPVIAVAFSPDGRRALTSAGGPVRLWDLESKEQIRQFDHEALSLVFVSESRALAGDGDGLIRMWDVETGQDLLRMDKHFDDVDDLELSPDGRYVLSCSRDGTARLWDLESGWEVRRMKGDGTPMNCVDFAPDGKYVLTAGAPDSAVRLWRLNLPEEK